MVVAAILLAIAAPVAQSGALEQARRIHDRLAGVPPTDQVLLDMTDDINGVDGRNEIDAAYTAMDNPGFYNATLKNWAAPWTNRDQSVFVPLNDYTATIVGMVRDDVLQATAGEQRPFISASITGRPIYIVGGADTRGIAGPVLEISPSGGTRQDADLTAWEAALKLDTVDGYRAYLAARPEGAFAEMAEANVAQLLDPAALGGKLKPSSPGLIGLSALPSRYEIERGPPLPIDGVWRLSTNGKRLRIEGGRAFAVDSWVHLIVSRVYTDQVVMRDMLRTAAGVYEARDILINGDATLKLRKDGNFDVKVATFPFPVSFKLIREGVDDDAAFESELENRNRR